MALPILNKIKQWDAFRIIRNLFADPTAWLNFGEAVNGTPSERSVIGVGGNGEISWLQGVNVSKESKIFAIDTVATGTGAYTFRVPYDLTVIEIRGSLTTASSSGAVTVDVNLDATSVFDTQKLEIAPGETTSVTAANQPEIVTASWDYDQEVTIDIDGGGTSADELKVTMVWTPRIDTLSVSGTFGDTTVGSPMSGSLTITGGVPPYTLLAGWTAPSGSTLSLSTATITDTGATDTVDTGQTYSGSVMDSEGATAAFSGSVDVAAGLTYATWDSAAKGTSVALSNGDLTSTISSTASTNRSRVRCTAGKSSGKWFFAIRRESTAGIGGNLDIGIGNATAVYTGTPGYLGLDANTWGHLSDGYKAHSGYSAYGSSWDTVGDIVCCAIDIDAGKIWFGKWNGSSITWFGTGSPSAGTDPAFSGLAAGTYYAFNAGFRSGVDAESDAAFGDATFGLTPPSGFSWWTDP